MNSPIKDHHTVSYLIERPPIIEHHNGIDVVRDDLLPGGTKSRYLIHLFEHYDEIVYATPAFGGAQLALAYCAQLTGKRAALFVAKRATPHPRTLQARRYGAAVYQVTPGYLATVQARAKRYAADTGAYYLPFGADTSQAIADIAEAAATIGNSYDQVWCAAGSGTLCRGLQNGIQAKEFHAVQVGKPPQVGTAILHQSGLPFEKELTYAAPFPSCPNYDRKAYALCRKHARGRVLFWNVMG